jgi:hypothetical protein
MTTKLSFRIFSLIVLFAMLLGLAATPQVAQAAATIPTPTISLTFAKSPIFPDEAAQLSVKMGFGDFSTVKNNISEDTQITLTSSVDLGGLKIDAIDTSTGNSLNSVTLRAGQSSFWMSAFGGPLSRHAVRKDSGKSPSYKLSFTPTRSRAGTSIKVEAKIFVGANKSFNGGGSWSVVSDMGSATVRVTKSPVLAAASISGPYTQAIEKSVQLEVYNPDVDTLNGLHIDYQIGPSGNKGPDFSTYQFSADGISWQNVGQQYDSSTKTMTGQIGPVDGFSVTGGAKQNIHLKINFSSTGTDMAFPLTLWLKTIDGKVIDTLTTVMAVNTADVTILNSVDMVGPYAAGVLREFNVYAINPQNGGNYTSLNLNFALQTMPLSNVSQFEYYDPSTNAWIALSPSGLGWTSPVSGGFALSLNSAVNIKFRVSFTLPGSYPFQLSLMDGNTAVKSTPITAVVDPNVAVLSMANFNAPFTKDIISDPFTLTINNPLSGATYTTLRIDYTISGLAPADVTSFQCLYNGVWTDASKSGTTTVAGSLPPTSGQPLNPGASLPYQCQITIAKEGSYTLTFNLVNVSSPAIPLATYTVTADVFPADLPVTGGGFYYLPMIVQ